MFNFVLINIFYFKNGSAPRLFKCFSIAMLVVAIAQAAILFIIETGEKESTKKFEIMTSLVLSSLL